MSRSSLRLFTEKNLLILRYYALKRMNDNWPRNALSRFGRYYDAQNKSLLREELSQEMASKGVENLDHLRKRTLIQLPYPRDIAQYLDLYIIGQEEAKKVLSVGIYQHYKRIAYNNNIELEKSNLEIKNNASMISDKQQIAYESFIIQKILEKRSSIKSADIEKALDQQLKKPLSFRVKELNLEKANILLAGPSGVGKTYMIQVLADILNVPLAIFDCTTLTQAGYVGDDADSIVQKLVDRADGNIEKAMEGIIFLDEIDKIASSRDVNSNSNRDVGGRGAQQSLLKILEGTTLKIKTGQSNKKVEIDTSDILFIASGAFIDLEKIIAKRICKSNIGFGSNKTSNFKNDDFGNEEKNNILKEADQVDFIKFGMIPELVGRFPVSVIFQSLKKEDLIRIMNEPRNSLISQMKKQFELDNINVNFTDCALREIAQEAADRNTGARALRSIMERILLNAKYEFPGSAVAEFTVDKNFVMKYQKYKPTTINDANSDDRFLVKYGKKHE